MAATIVLAPGTLCTADLFAPQIAALGASRCHVADLTQDDRIEAMAARLLASVDGPFILIGLSMGGIVAFEVLRQAPERVAGLVLMNTGPYADLPAARAARLAQIARTAREGLAIVMREDLKPAYLGSDKTGDPEIMRIVDHMADELGADVFIRQSEALTHRCDSVALLPDIRRPTLIIGGSEDRVTPPKLQRLMAEKIPQATLAILPGCGHLSTLERPQDVNQLLVDFVSGIDQDLKAAS